MNAKPMTNGKEATLDDVYEELRIHNRLMILSLVQRGITQSDIAGAIGKANSVVSEMFPKGMLKRIARQSKVPVNGFSE